MFRVKRGRRVVGTEGEMAPGCPMVRLLIVSFRFNPPNSAVSNTEDLLKFVKNIANDD
jgi:hypothetical protein